MKCRALGVQCGLCWALLASPAQARAPQLQLPPLQASTLLARVGIANARALLRSPIAGERERGLERLGQIGTAQALASLVDAFRPDSPARERLLAVRALAPHAGVPIVRQRLVQAMLENGGAQRPGTLNSAIGHAAALALAASHDTAALSALAEAVHQSDGVAEIAADALLAFPPPTLAPLLESRATPTTTLVQLLSRLGDPRAVPALREMVRGAATEVSAEAAVALAQFGDTETIDLAQHWRLAAAPPLRLAAARILLQFHRPEAASALAPFLKDEATRTLGLELARAARLPALVPTLIEIAPTTSADERNAVYAALARGGTREAISFLASALGGREPSSGAALALALMPGTDANAVLEHALSNPSTRRIAVRAAVARLVALDRAPAGLKTAVRALSRSRDASDQAVAAEAQAVLAPRDAAQLLEHAQVAVTRGIARAVLIPEVANALGVRLETETDPALRDALAAALISPRVAQRVPSALLEELIEARGLSAPLAARALATRDSPRQRVRILSLLGSSDWLMRSQTALGLGQSQDPTALGLLEGAYRFETDERVRLAIVQALTQRPEPVRRRTLELSRTLDASPAVRAAATLSAEGARLDPQQSGPQSAWLTFSAPGGGAPQVGAGAIVLTANGLAVPAFADPDGVLLVPALPAGEFALRLAAEPRIDDAPPVHSP